ncbi:MAG: RNA methyltransferase [Planctomycetes bacterium]|nr:RNA methyltransferase [Planctomycetota bacterium]
MNSDRTIRSRENALLKRVGAALAGKEPGTLVLEGDRLVDDALAAGLALEVVLVSDARPERAAELERAHLGAGKARPGAGMELRLVDADLLARASRLKTPPGILALCAVPPAIEAARIELATSTLLLVAAGVADPGNLGALARSAEAFGADALFVARGGASPWNEKALRGSMGSLLRLPVGANADAAELARALAARGVRQVCAATRGGADPKRFDWTGPIALWVSGETGGIPEAAARFERLTIPMKRGVESLNVTVAASLLLHAAGRIGGAS